MRDKVGITFSAFDLLHPGHLEFLRLCKLNCDRLVVGLHVDPSKERPDTKEKPVETVLERLTRLQACKHVDEVIVYETERDLLNILHTRTDVTIRFLGTDYLDKDFTGKGIKEDWHIARDHDWSSTSLRNRIRKQDMPKATVPYCGHSGVELSSVGVESLSDKSRSILYYNPNTEHVLYNHHSGKYEVVGKNITAITDDGKYLVKSGAKVESPEFLKRER